MNKIELHCHFDGSVNIEYASKKLGYNLQEKLASFSYQDLSSYLANFNILIPLLQTKEELYEASRLLANDLVKDEVIYAEIRFCPLFHNQYLNSNEVIDTILSGLRSNTKVKTNLILCMMRQFDDNKNKEIIDLAYKYLNKGVCAIDLAGDEKKYPTKMFKSLFEYAKSLNIPYTIHAGEADGFESVESAISFNTKRIGHGVRSIENEETIKKLINQHITLEVCLKSNIDTKVYDNILNHPIKKLVEKGVLVTINTDNRTVSMTSLNNEYQLLKANFNFSDKDIRQFNLNAINATFISEEEKNELKELI